jgi:hypothetical protein
MSDFAGQIMFLDGLYLDCEEFTTFEHNALNTT